MADIEIDKLRIQIGNPCENREEDIKIEFMACDESIQQIDVPRKNCDRGKIIGWFTRPNTNTHVGDNSSGQVILRTLNNCSTTEIRSDVNAMRFQSNRQIAGTGEKAKIFCGRDTTFLGLNSNFTVYGPVEVEDAGCISGKTIYYRAKSTPIQDIDWNNSNPIKIGLCSTGTNYPFVQYGTTVSGFSGDILTCDIISGCVTNTNELFFLYIPCEHYASNCYGAINDKAFSYNTGLRGLWIDGYWSRSGDPFYQCNNLEIVYCPLTWVSYFENYDSFPNIKYINGNPYSEGTRLPTSC